MEKKKKHNIFLKVLGILFIIYVGLFIANMSGYYESKIRSEVTVTENGIKEFEEKVKNGEEIDINNFLKKERIDYSNGFSNLGDSLTSNIENSMQKCMKVFTNIIKSLF